MIGYIKGKVKSLKNGILVLENNGMGYEITCSNSVMRKYTQEDDCEVFTYLSVKDDGISLFGFVSEQEKIMFLKLITVSGVGPKMGITVLSGMELSRLITCIAASDVKELSKIKGLGKKTAERIIVELREKVGAVQSESCTANSLDYSDSETQVNQDAVIALMSLGFTKAECTDALKKAMDNGAVSIEELISSALKNMR